MVNDGLFKLPNENNPIQSFETLDKKIVLKKVKPEELEDSIIVSVPLIEKYYFYSQGYSEELFNDLDDFYATLGEFNFRIAAEGTLQFISETKIEIKINTLAVYVKDNFDYVGFQLLGNWDLKNGLVNGFSRDSYIITNSDYRDYRKLSNKGNDFYWYSTIKHIDVSEMNFTFDL